MAIASRRVYKQKKRVQAISGTKIDRKSLQGKKNQKCNKLYNKKREGNIKFCFRSLIIFEIGL